MTLFDEKQQAAHGFITVCSRIIFKMGLKEWGSAGSKNKSGCKTNRDFVQFIEKFIGHVRPSINNKVVLFWDNHSSHLSIEA